MIDIDPNTITQTLTILGLSIIAILFGYNKLTKDWKTNSAEASIITLMHTELERMSTQNTALSTEIGRLHEQVIALNKQLQGLHIENQRLQSEVVALTSEISELKASVMLKGKGHATSQN